MRGSIRVVLDTNVLYGQFSRYLLLSLSLQGMLLPFWSPTILDELIKLPVPVRATVLGHAS